MHGMEIEWVQDNGDGEEWMWRDDGSFFRGWRYFLELQQQRFVKIRKQSGTQNCV